MIREPEKLVTDFHTHKMVARRSVKSYSLNCAGCGRLTNEYDHFYGWHVCPECDSDAIAADLADRVMNAGGF